MNRLKPLFQKWSEAMTNQEAFYALGNLPIPVDDTNYDICQYQEVKQ